MTLVSCSPQKGQRIEFYAHPLGTGRRGIAQSGVQRLPISAHTDTAIAPIRSQSKASGRHRTGRGCPRAIRWPQDVNSKPMSALFVDREFLAQLEHLTLDPFNGVFVVEIIEHVAYPVRQDPGFLLLE